MFGTWIIHQYLNSEPITVMTRKEIRYFFPDSAVPPPARYFPPQFLYRLRQINQHYLLLTGLSINRRLTGGKSSVYFAAGSNLNGVYRRKDMVAVSKILKQKGYYGIFAEYMKSMSWIYERGVVVGV